QSDTQLPDKPENNVGLPASGEADDPAHRPRRISLRPGDARSGRHRGCADGELQELTAGEFHCDLPNPVNESPRAAPRAQRIGSRIFSPGGGGGGGGGPPPLQEKPPPKRGGPAPPTLHNATEQK